MISKLFQAAMVTMFLSLLANTGSFAHSPFTPGNAGQIGHTQNQLPAMLSLPDS